MSPRGVAVPTVRVRLRTGVSAGILATLTMDGAMLAAARVGGRPFASDRLGVGMIGRWMAGLARGRWRMPDVSLEPAVPGEAALGLITHYATGVALTEAYLLLAPAAVRRGLVPAAAYGVATGVLPLLVMFPSMGYGAFGSRSGEAGTLLRVMGVGHVAFGIGIGLWTRRLLPLRGDERRG